MEGAPVLHQVYEALVAYEQQPDGSLKTVPCLAESWNTNVDASVWTVRLRRGVTFQAPASREVTAADIVADLRYLAAPVHKAQIVYMYVPIKGTDQEGYASGGALGVEALDRYTVRFTLKYPFSEFADSLGSFAFWVWPADYLRRVGLTAYEQHPVGTGPYMFQRAAPGKSIDLVRDPHWWDTSGGPYIDTIHFEVFSSVLSMMSAFKMGRIDWTSVPPGQVAASRSQSQLKSGQWKAKALFTPQLWIGCMYANMNDPVVGGRQGLVVRQALTYACDRQAAIDAASAGVEQVQTTLIPPGVPGSRDFAEPYRYDPARAKELIDQHGPVRLSLVYPQNGFDRVIAETFKASYAKVGITLKTRGLPWDRYLDSVANGGSQLFNASWVADYPSMDNFLYPLFETGSAATTGSFYSDREVDALLKKARATPDEFTRVRLYQEAEGKILADAAVIPVLLFREYRVTSTGSPTSGSTRWPGGPTCGERGSGSGRVTMGQPGRHW
jgi:oligopeptide transport system substrate-binding protein